MWSEPGLPLLRAAARHGERLAIVDACGETTYAELLEAARRAADRLLEGRDDLAEARVAFMVPPGAGYAAVQWGIWAAGGITVPLCISHPAPEIEYVLADTGAEIVVAHPEFKAKLAPLAEAHRARLVSSEELVAPAADDADHGQNAPEFRAVLGPERRAMILYTSGTTSRPKGVVSTHGTLAAQVSTLVDSWGWWSDDRILHVLPLHHTHGIVNALTCALWSGAACEMMPRFEARAAWERFASGEISVFMAVPTIYVKLIAAWEEAAGEERARWSEGARGMRLMVSGSAALPVSVFERWREITGHELLERYGMTEIGMALSNPLEGERRPGSVGAPLPGVELRLVDEEGGRIEGEGIQGEIEVSGPCVFHEYWGKPEATREAFREGWFRTGDEAVLERGYYRILGRRSVDIIKTGGYKVSALEIEEVLRTHPGIAECAVVGVEDPEWGERVAVAVVPAAGQGAAENGAARSAATCPSFEALRDWARERLASYKVPRAMVRVEELPRNVMGKVTKGAVRKMFE